MHTFTSEQVFHGPFTYVCLNMKSNCMPGMTISITYYEEVQVGISDVNVSSVDTENLIQPNVYWNISESTCFPNLRQHNIFCDDR